MTVIVHANYHYRQSITFFGGIFYAKYLLKLGFNVELIDQYSNVRHKFLTRFLFTRLKPIDLHYIDFGLIRIFFLINLILFLCLKVNFLLIHFLVSSQK
jgi:hypothetical protein